MSAAELSSPIDTQGMDFVAISYFERITSNPRTSDVHNCDRSLNIYYARDEEDWAHHSAMCRIHSGESRGWGERRLTIPTAGAASMRIAFTYTLQNSEAPDPDAAYLIDDFRIEARRAVDPA